ncbi:hypothetical protein ASD35_08460 [Pelomonas sp. Root1444]|nr:hypothetical protein ASD35_08460 [Pelomonas sp. Root1444]
MAETVSAHGGAVAMLEAAVLALLEHFASNKDFAGLAEHRIEEAYARSVGGDLNPVAHDETANMRSRLLTALGTSLKGG